MEYDAVRVPTRLFFALPHERQLEEAAILVNLLNRLKRIEIHAFTSIDTYRIGNEVFTATGRFTYIIPATDEVIEVLSTLFGERVQKERIVWPEPVEVRAKYLVIDVDGKKHYVSVGTIATATYDFTRVPVGIVSYMLEQGLAGMVRITIEEMGVDEAIQFLRDYETFMTTLVSEAGEEIAVEEYRVLLGTILGDEAPGRYAKPHPPLSRLVALGEERLYKLRFIIAVVAEDLEKLERAKKILVEYARDNGLLLTFPRFLQYWLYTGRSVPVYVVNSLGLTRFYPFGSDAINEEGGILLATAVPGNRAVVLNPWRHMPPAMFIAGKQGSGKSLTMKVFAERVVERWPDTYLFVLDPTGEYEELAKRLGLRYIELSSERGFGLDPVALNLQPAEAASIIMRVLTAYAGGEKLEKYAERKALIQKILARHDRPRRLPELARRVLDAGDPELHTLLMKSYEAYKPLFTGSPLDVTTSFVLSMKKIMGDDPHSRTYRSVVTETVLRRVWRAIDDGVIPYEIPKMILVDEAWYIVEAEHAGAELASWLETIARLGRKRYLYLVFSSQSVADMLETNIGLVLWRTAATRIILRHDPTDKDVLVKRGGLPEKLVDEIAKHTLEPGYGIVHVMGRNVIARIIVTREQLRAYSTSPV